MFQCHWVKFLQFHLPEWVQIWLEHKANISDWNQCTLEQCSLSGLYIHSKQFMVVYWEYNSWVKYKLEQLQFAVQHSFAAMQLTQLRLQRFNIKRMLSFVQLQLLVVTSDTQQLNKISKLNSCWQVVSTLVLLLLTLAVRERPFARPLQAEVFRRPSVPQSHNVCV